MNKQVMPNERHMAASAIIITKEKPKKTVLLFHKKLGRWLQPGGHVEQFENPLETVIREVKEETGIDVSFLFEKIKKLNSSKVLSVPDFFLEEDIPAHGETPSHYHIDLLYVIEVPFQNITMQEEEHDGIGWFSLEESLKLPLYDNTKMMLQKAMGK